MASTGKTSNYKLNQWIKTDPVLMDDFNADNSKIDAAIKAVENKIPKTTYGSYVGTDKYGSSNKNTLTFSFVPRLVCLNGHALIRGQDNISLSGGYCYFTWNDKKLSWYSPQGYTQQMNSSLSTYYYWATE